MENQRKQQKNVSGNKFSFPIIHIGEGDGNPSSDPEFEFGNTNTTATPPSPNSPADQLFSNGKMLPHSFPVFHPPMAGIYGRCSSSRDSMRSSRSNSTNSSRSSTTSVSARSSVSTTDGSEIRRNLIMRHDDQNKKIKRNDLDIFHNHKYGNIYNRNSRSQSQSQRWQFIAPMPVMGRQASVRRKEEVATATDEEKKKKQQQVGVGRRFLRSIVNACKECHAMP